jgi:hypothetical protein
LWAIASLSGAAAVWRSRRSGLAEQELRTRRALRRLVILEHVALAVALASGVALLQLLGWRLGQRRWLDLKLGLVGFLLVPLEAMHAWVSHVWIERGLRQTPSPPFSQDLARGIGMDDMVRTLSALLLGAAVPVMLWLSVKQPWMD